MKKTYFYPFAGVDVKDKIRDITYFIIEGELDNKVVYHPVVKDKLLSLPFPSKEKALQYAEERATEMVRDLRNHGIRARTIKKG